MAYGDALGFLNENIKEKSSILKDFVYKYDSQLAIEKPKGQYSYVTELMLIIIKCLIDDSKAMRVTIDYPRFYEELKLWSYYRHGKVPSILQRLKEKNYYNSVYYWEDKSCYGISRIIPIFLANKNYRAAEIEVYKNIIYFNRHPRVILTGLLLLRAGFLLLEKQFMDRGELLDNLKTYLIHLQLNELNHNMKSNLSSKYSIQFEKEKIQYLMNLDRYKNNRQNTEGQFNDDIILNSIESYYKLLEKGTLYIENYSNHYDKETKAIAYCFWGMGNNEYNIPKGSLKDEIFIYEMGRFLYRLREFQSNRKLYDNKQKNLDIFKLTENTIIKHPILNIIKIKEKEETSNYIKVLVQTKSSIYTFIKHKTKQ